jgi:LacI family transcriptional regulator, gluconate utilization system Gnt-I transcriptional repressor
VARLAGVHASTVSRFFSHPAVISARTAARIESAVTELGYAPNLVARSLASSKGRLVALLVPDLAYSNFNEAIEEITSGLANADMNVMLCLTGSSPERTEQLIAAAMRWRVDAVIAWTPIPPGGAKLLRASGTSVLQISDVSSDPVDLGIGFNEFEAGRALARFVGERGYVRPYLVATMGPYSARRREGFVKEWRRLNGSKATEQRIDPPANFQQGRRIFADIRRLKRRPDVVVCASDYLAQAIIVEAGASGLRVPDDLAVIGFGNTPMAGDMRPTITTVDLHTKRIPAEVLSVLDARGRGETLPRQHIDLGFDIIARESA